MLPKQYSDRNVIDCRGKCKWQPLKIVVVLFIVLVLCLLITLGTIGGVSAAYANKIYKGIYIGNLDLSGLNAQDAQNLIDQKIKTIEQGGLRFVYNGQEVAIAPTIYPTTDMDLSREILNINTDKTIENAFLVGRTGSIWEKIKEVFNVWTNKKNITAVFNLNDKELLSALKGNFSAYENLPQNASLSIHNGNDNGDSVKTTALEKVFVKVIPEKKGWGFNYEKAIAEARYNISLLNNSKVKMEMVEILPSIKKVDTAAAIELADKVSQIASTTIIYNNKKWLLSINDVAAWMDLGKDKDNKVFLFLNPDKAVDFFAKLKKDIEVEPRDAKFVFKDGRATEFQESRDGLKVDLPNNVLNIQNTIFGWAQSGIISTSSIDLIVEKTEAKVTIDKINNYGIKEIIGTGQSNFKGSPNNRRKNIKNGAQSLSGILIKPGEEFSLVKALGEIDEKSGYFPELVIKGNKTTPEFGGGLCQIGTTVFRAALASGLPIIARTNHSYRVVYYEPAGKDATIYNPQPDFKFINDTGNYIMIQSSIDGDNIYFYFWGRKDGRIAEQTDSKVYNIVSPGPTKYIDSEDLKPGEKKCTESAHAGATAEFEYKVTYPNGDVKEKKFTSKYRPWQAVCLVGVDPNKKIEVEVLKAP